MRPLIMVVEAGGMRNVMAAAFLERIEELGFDWRRRVLAAWTSSSASLTTMFGLAGQIREAVRVYQEELVRPEVFSWRRLGLLQRPADIGYLVDKACSGLDWRAALNSGVQLWVNVLDLNTGLIHHVQVDEKNWRRLVRATCALPLLAEPERPGLVDGGAVVPMPLLEAYEWHGAADYLVISNRPEGYMVPWYMNALQAQLSLAVAPAAYRQFCRVRWHYQEWRDFAADPPEDGTRVFLVQPPQALPCSRLDRSPERVQAAAAQGRVMAETVWGELETFLASAA